MKLFRFIFIILLIILNVYTFSHPRYENISEGGSPNLFNMIRWKLTRDKPQWPKLPENNTTSINNIEHVVKVSEMVITYINHSSFLMQMSGVNILIDPIWSKYAGPFGKFGVERSIYPGISIEELPKIDVILISHSHYDHLDLPTIDEITKNYKPIIITGLGVSGLIGYCQTHTNLCWELNWWDNVQVANTDIKIHFVPAHHWSSRFLFDKNTTLWGGFVIQKNQENIYFAGDTGFADGKIFKQIKDKFKKFTLSLLPIGAYKPNWFFYDMHTSPEEAVKIFKILDSKYAIPTHFDTFQLSDEKYQDPLLDLQEALSRSDVEKEKFHIMEPGQSWKIPN